MKLMARIKKKEMVPGLRLLVAKSGGMPSRPPPGLFLVRLMTMKSTVDKAGDSATTKCSNDSGYWYKKGKFHRIGGPAIEYPDGHKEWFVDGERHRIDGPAIEYPDGHEEWFLDGKRHRIDGPAIELANGSKFWFVNGGFHRTDGPAVEDANGSKEYYLFGEKYDDPEVFRVASDMLVKLFPEMTVREND